MGRVANLIPRNFCPLQVSEDKHKTGTNKVFPRKVVFDAKKDSLLASRRYSFHEQKPSFSPEELIANRKHGVSFSCIGKKLGIDNTKGEVLNMFTVMKECDNTLPDMKKVQSPALRSYLTPLWYLFDSELDILIWRDCGCPSFGVLSTIKKNTRNCYKYEVQLKRQAEHIKSEKLAKAWCNACNTDFWHLVRKQRGNGKSSCNVIDNLTTDDSINVLKNLFNT